MLANTDMMLTQAFARSSSAPTVLDLLRRDALLDSDIDAVVDTYLANPGERFCVLQSLYRVDFDAITASMRRCAKRSSLWRDGDARQALTCALLMHRPQTLRPCGAGARPKDPSEIGKRPPLGHVPAKMQARAIRRARHGRPEQAHRREALPVWEVGDDAVLVDVMAAGVNDNGVRAGPGAPFAHRKRASAADRFVPDQRIAPCLSEVSPGDRIPPAHARMGNNPHAPGPMACRVDAPPRRPAHAGRGPCDRPSEPAGRDPVSPSEDFDGRTSYDLTARLLVKGAELSVHAHTRRDLCILTEALLQDLHARGIDPRVIVEGHGAYRRIRIRRYLDDVCRELRSTPDPSSQVRGR